MSARDPGFNKQIAEEAAAWFVDFSVGDVEPDQRARFNSWLRTSPLHVRAYLQVTALWEEAALLKLDAAALEALAGKIASEGNVVPLRQVTMTVEPIEPTPPAAVSQVPSRPMRHRFAIAACISLLSAIGVVAVWTRAEQGTIYATAIGEQRTTTLADGSTVQLNSQSRLRVLFDERERKVELIDGQALFEVAKNPARPFVVVSGKTSVRAVGTQFDVYRKGAGTVVTVVEGRVAVSDEAGRVTAPALEPTAQSNNQATTAVGGAVLISAGEQIVVAPAAVLKPQPANVAAAIAWTQQKLLFDAAPLSDVVAEFNRYSHRRLILDDAALDEIRISGVFASSGVDHLLEFLQQRFDLSVTTTDDRIHIAGPRQSSSP